MKPLGVNRNMIIGNRQFVFLLFCWSWSNGCIDSPLLLLFLNSFVKILLLMTFISISIFLKTSNILDNKSQMFEESDCTITVHSDLYYNELKI